MKEMKETSKETVLYHRLYKALQQAAISEGQQLESTNHDRVKDTCQRSKLSHIAILELREYMDQLIDALNLSYLVMFQGHTIRSFADAAYMVKQFQPIIIAQLSRYNTQELLCPYECVINCCDEFSGVGIFMVSLSVES